MLGDKFQELLVDRVTRSLNVVEHPEFGQVCRRDLEGVLVELFEVRVGEREDRVFLVVDGVAGADIAPEDLEGGRGQEQGVEVVLDELVDAVGFLAEEDRARGGF